MATVEELILKVAELTEYEREEFLAALKQKYTPACPTCGSTEEGPHACPGFPRFMAAPAYGGPPSMGGPRSWQPQTEFTVSLSDVGANKIMVIKTIRDVLGTGWGLKECKELVDRAATQPQLLKEFVSRPEAQELREKFEAAGAKVTIT